MVAEKYIHFDWAVKRMLRDKANFGVLEGLLTVLLEEKITIAEILESESNQDSYDDKFNRVDIKARNSKDEIIIVEVQLSREVYFLERILYGVSKAICEHVSLGSDYDKVKKVYSVNILYFDMGTGKDYLYHGKTEFKGVFADDVLKISRKQQNTFRKWPAGSVFPEYYLIRVNQFNELAKTPIEEWMEYIKNGVIKDDTQVPGLQEAREKLKYISMTAEERLAYERHLDNIRIQNDVINTAKNDGLAEGREEGRAEGREEGRAEGRAEGREEGRAETNMKNARGMKAKGMSVEDIAEITGLSIEEIEKL
ncbi:MAG: Rpn family recombination-promoting nuclease/putative transposase [Paludibacteraceae bacterium]|nr:Rpn family recombination-promoting nuclease/putative transposase [Paludibacteraceae bacterium]